MLENLLSAPVLFFALGLAARFVRSDLEVPQPVARFLSLYLLLSIGIKGGHELHDRRICINRHGLCLLRGVLERPAISCSDGIVTP